MEERKGFCRSLLLLPYSPFLLFLSLERRHLIAEETRLVAQAWLNMWIYLLLGQDRGNEMVWTCSCWILTARHIMLEMREDLDQNPSVHQECAAVFSFSSCRSTEEKRKDVVSSETASVSSPVENSVLCLLPGC